MAPLQRSVHWRLALWFLINPMVFFMDIFTDPIFAASCRHGNGTDRNGSVPPSAGINQSGPGDTDADWWMEAGGQNVTDHFKTLMSSSDKGPSESVCAWLHWLTYNQTLFMVGMLLGSLIGGPISDRYGKRLLMLVCMSMFSGCVLLPAVVAHPVLYLALRFATGVFCSCITTCSFSLAVEWTRPEARVWPSAVLFSCFSFGTMVTALLAWLSPTLTKLHLAAGLPLLVLLPLFFAIPESPCWLLLMKKKNILERYRDNSPEDKRLLDLILDSAWSELQKASEVQQKVTQGGHALSAHLKHPTVLLRLFIMSFLSTAISLTYYGICMNIGAFNVNMFLAQFFSGLSEMPCLLVPLLRWGRRPLIMLTLFLSGAACCLTLLLSSYHMEPTLVLCLALLGKFCSLVATLMAILYNIELFPTVVRQRCISLVNLCFRLGSLGNSLISSNSNGVISMAAFLVYSCGPIIGSGLCLMLPETSRTPLPDTVEDCVRQPLPSLFTPGWCGPSNRNTESICAENSGETSKELL